PAEARTHYYYDQWGNQTKVEDANGHTTENIYDSLHGAYVVETRNAIPGQVIIFTYDYGRGLKTGETDLNNQTTGYRYDDLGRLTKIIRPGDSEANPTRQYAYQFPTFDTNGLIVQPFRVMAQQRDDNGYMTGYSFYNG